MKESLPPIVTAHLFSELDDKLLDLLRSLTPEEWGRPTVAGAWNVRHVTAHLLDTALRRLAFGRDRSLPSASQIRSGEDLIGFVNDVNAQGVQVLGRLSPPALISLMEIATRELSDYLQSLDPNAKAAIAVSWAGERESLNWFDIARELTERWHHQQQIRLAVGKPGIMTPRLYAPVLDCFMRALPHALSAVSAAEGAVAQVIVSGECGGVWQAERLPGGWTLVGTADPTTVVARTTIPQEIAWRVFTKGIDRADALRETTVEGDPRIGGAVMGMVAIVG